jgi:hypothetical protein
MNNGKYHTKSYKLKQLEKIDRLYGVVEKHAKNCVICGQDFIFEGRKNTKQFESAKYCSRSCANNRQKWWDNNAIGYRTIAFKHWKQECAICGFDKIVAVHHIDENKNNNKPDNLIPLCPNHHEMVHSKWSDEVIPLINDIVKQKYSGK